MNCPFKKTSTAISYRNMDPDNFIAAEVVTEEVFTPCDTTGCMAYNEEGHYCALVRCEFKHMIEGIIK